MYIYCQTHHNEIEVCSMCSDPLHTKQLLTMGGLQDCHNKYVARKFAMGPTARVQQSSLLCQQKIDCARLRSRLPQHLSSESLFLGQQCRRDTSKTDAVKIDTRKEARQASLRKITSNIIFKTRPKSQKHAYPCLHWNRCC
jgi:hypothetical protein